MIKKIDEQEQSHLNLTLASINNKISALKDKIFKLGNKIDEEKDFIAQNYYELSKEEVLARHYTSLAEIDDQHKDYIHQVDALSKQKQNPYFARIDFAEDGQQARQVYIGMGNVLEKADMLVYDWRSPIASMYYDYEVGPASYMAGRDLVKGEITLKRQYKIENSQIISYFDTNLTINDEILQSVLGQNSSAKMKQIVSSIQKEQNAIVRKSNSTHILVQGIAGSGKTSIALHRAAYLLYAHRKSLKSSDIMILSPNNIFSSYISDVLPQLGEQNITETTFSQIAHVELRKPLEEREDMLDRIATRPKQNELNEISYKSSFEYLDELKKFLYGDFIETYNPSTLNFITKVDDEGNILKQFTFAEDQTRKLFFEVFKGYTFAERINKIAWQYAMVFTTERHYNKTQNSGLKDRFKNILSSFLPINDIYKIYEIFCARQGLCKPSSETISYMDKGALLLIKEFLYGFNHDFSAKYFIVDEVQDFTPTELYVFKKIWHCPSIMLGDVNQCIEKTLASDYVTTLAKLTDSEIVTLSKTYRSTKDIAEFAHNMIGLKNVEYVNRKGLPPQIIQSADVAETIAGIIEEHCSSFQHIAIICKCNKELRELSKVLKKKVNFKIIKEPEDYNHKILLTTVATAKGIEFDAVIIPNATATNYNSPLDKNMLYVSSTRALHKLFYIYEDSPSKFLKQN